MIVKLHKLSAPSCSNFYLIFLQKKKKSQLLLMRMFVFFPGKNTNKKTCKALPERELSHRIILITLPRVKGKETDFPHYLRDST